MAAQGISVNRADEAPLKKLDQLLNFTNYNDMAKAKQGINPFEETGAYANNPNLYSVKVKTTQKIEDNRLAFVKPKR